MIVIEFYWWCKIIYDAKYEMGSPIEKAAMYDGRYRFPVERWLGIDIHSK